MISSYHSVPSYMSVSLTAFRPPWLSYSRPCTSKSFSPHHIAHHSFLRAISTSPSLRLAKMAHPEASSSQNMMNTDGARDPVWVHREPYSNRPKFPKLTQDIDDIDVCIVGAGISGVQTAYECVGRGMKVALIEAREVLSGQTGRTSGHLSNALDAPYPEIAKKHGVSIPPTCSILTNYVNRIQQLKGQRNLIAGQSSKSAR